MWCRPLPLALLLAGCHAFLPLEGRGVTGQELGDAPPADLGAESPGPLDGPAAEGAPDGAPGGDVTVARDMASGETVAPPDVGGDGPAVTGGCKTNQLMLYASGTMALCQLSPPRNHCTAHQACTGGWHLCAMSEFLARGGKTEPAQQKAWLQGCLPQGYSGFPLPMNGFCSCNPGFGSTYAATWPCAGSTAAPTSSSSLALGILADTTLQTLGTIQDPSYCAYWTADMPSKAFGAALCCQ